MLSPRQIETFAQDGVLELRGFYRRAEIGDWLAEIAAYFGAPQTPSAWREALAVRKPDDFRLTDEPTPRSHAALAAVYRAIAPDVDWVGHNQLVVRPGDDPAEWRGARIAHLDIPLYAPLRTLVNSVTYLTAVRERGGAFFYWPGSHRVAWEYFSEFPQDYLAEGARSHNQVFERLIARMPTAPIEFTGDPGDLLLWHALTLHSASINKRPEVRMALFGRWGERSVEPCTAQFRASMRRRWCLTGNRPKPPTEQGEARC